MTIGIITGALASGVAEFRAIAGLIGVAVGASFAFDIRGLATTLATSPKKPNPFAVGGGVVMVRTIGGVEGVIACFVVLSSLN